MALNINGTTGISGVDGSASAPALQGTDSNTGINFASDTVNINTGGSTRATVDSSGALDVPTNFPIKVGGSQKLKIESTGNLQIARDNYIGTVASGQSIINIGTSGGAQIGFHQVSTNNDELRFYTHTSGVAHAERMRLDSSGRLLISTTSTSAVTGGSANAKFFDAADGCRLMSSRGSSAVREHIVFLNPVGDVGDISTDGSHTSFNTSSDYRLKENQVTISDGILRLKTLKPYKFNWKADTSTIVDGFFAHEVSTVVPEAITGAKDATENCSNVVLNKDGKFLEKNVTQEQWEKGKAQEPPIYPSDSTWSASYTKNVYQKIDHSKLVPLLTAALQEAVAKIETLETKVAALEAG